MFSKLLDKISEKIAGKASEIHEDWKKNFSAKPPPGLGQKIDMEKLRKVLETPPRPKTPRPPQFPKELRTKKVTTLPKAIREMAQTTIEIEDNEMEKVVKVVIDIGPNLSDVMRDMVNECSSPAISIQTAFGKFLETAAQNIVLVLKETSKTETTGPK